MNTRNLILAILLLLCPFVIEAQKNLYVFKNNSIVFHQSAHEIDRVALQEEKTELSIRDLNGNVLYNEPLSEIDSVVLREKPVADVLDIVFKTDGTAEDISPMRNIVETFSSGALSTYYNATYDRYVAKFGNTWATNPSGYYKIDYINNTAFKNALADGHTLEAVVMANYEPPIADKEAKFFTSHEVGGTGFMVSFAKNGLNNTNELCFLPHVGGSWRHVVSGIVPVPQVYYHLIGTWDKQEGKARIYINGELKNTIDATGELKFPTHATASVNWFGLGCDAGPTPQLSWNGDLVLARIYDAPLTQQDVAVLWADIKEQQENAVPNMVSDINFLSGIAVKAGYQYNITGTGFAPGDKITFTSISDTSNASTLDCVLDGETGVSVTIPDNFKSDRYRMMLLRGDRKQDLGLVRLNMVTQMPKPAQIIAHRGFWDVEGAAQNSVAGIQNAQAYNFYGAELDVWITTDGHLMINHDATLHGVSIQNSTYDQVKDLTLNNGEKIPQLSDFLALVKNNESPTKLFIEIKEHAKADRNMAAAEAVVAAVKAVGVEAKVQYISFGFDICKRIVELDPDAEVGYVKGGKSPDEVLAAGINGLNYHITEFRNNPQWIERAKELGMSVTSWTLNTVEEIAEMTNAGVQFVCTDTPLDALKVKQYYENNQ